MTAATSATLAFAYDASAVTFSDALADNYGPGYVDIASVDVTSDATHLTFQINLNPSANLTAEDGSQIYGKYQIGFQTGNAGNTAIVNPYGNQIGISSGTGMDYWLGSWANNSPTPPFFGGAELYAYNGSAATKVAGNGTDPYIDVPVTLAATSTTISIPLASLGLAQGDTFGFDVWTTFDSPSGQSAYDALGKPTLTTDPGTPYSPVAPYDSGTTLLTYTVGGGTATSGTWTSNSGGNWSAASNWTGGVPNGVDHVATFGNAIAAASAVTIDGPKTVGTLNFDGANSYTLAGDALTLDVTTGAASVNVSAGSHNIDANVILADNTTINVNPAASALAFRGTLTATGRSISKTGAGVATFTNIRAAQLDVQAGTVRTTAQPTALAAAGTSTVNVLSIASGATLDLTNNALILDYETLGTLPADVRAMLASGRLSSSTATGSVAIGYVDNAVGTARTSFGGVSIDMTSLLLGVTLKGDADLSRTVNFADLVALAQNYNQVGNQTWQRGDFNYDGNVNFADLVLLAQNYNQNAPAAVEAFGASFASDWAMAQALLPEPTTLLLTGVASLLVARRRRA